MPDTYLIPTLSRSKISQEMSYPIGAEALSEGLASVPQLREIALHFFSRNRTRLPYNGDVIRIEYLNGELVTGWKFDLYGRPERSPWELIVQPVWVKERQLTQKQIREFALPRIGRWLEERAELEGKGNDILAFFFEGDLVERRLTNMYPVRPNKRRA